MSLSKILVLEIARNICTQLDAADRGHCIRVDHLAKEDAIALCSAVEAALDSSIGRASVLDPTADDAGLLVRPEQAIEIRNRKEIRFCLFVPAGLVDAAASSLANSFAEFDLDGCLRRVGRDLLEKLPEDLRETARQVIASLRGTARPTSEQWADYLSTLVEDPSAERAGTELWRVGLVPDLGGDGLPDRLSRNYRCVQELVRPARAQTSAAERLDAVGLRPGAVADELRAFLEPRRLRDARAWLGDLTRDPWRGRITFERWVFEEARASDLEAISVEPLLDAEGNVEKYTHLRQPGGAGTQPLAAVGPKAKVAVRWKCQPQSPTNLTRWRAELVPSRDEYAEEEIAGVDLPGVRTAARTRRASISLDLDLDNLLVRAVQVRVVALDEQGGELCGTDGKVIEGLSDEFWLSEEALPEAAPAKKRDSVISLPFARLKAAIELKVDAIEEAPGEWVERDLHYYSITLNGRRVSRIALSPILRAIELRCLENPNEGGAYEALVDEAESLDPEKHLRPVEVSSLWKSEGGATFLDRRRDLFRTIRRQDHRGLIEVAEWGPDLSKRARAYAASYRNLLATAKSLDEIATALSVDTIRLGIERTSVRDQAILVQPTHPLRLLWYAAYADLLRHWENELLKIERDRARSLDADLIERVAPLNCPAFIPGTEGGTFLFAQNLRLFWGLALPVQCKEPARLAAEVARVVGFPEDEASLADLPPERVATELRAYRDVHPYLDALRLSLVNPGSGGFVAAALREFVHPAGEDAEDEMQSGALRLEVLAHVHPPLPLRIPALADLQQELYDERPRGKRHHLAPFFSVAVRSVSESERLPGGDVNLTLATDQLVPTISTSPPSDHEDSSSLYGLMVRFLPRFVSSDGGALWQHHLSFPPESPRERHPVVAAYTNDLVDSHREILNAVRRLLPEKGQDGLPAVTVELTAEDRIRLDRMHRVSDWVISLDRFFGVEFFDDPGDPNLSGVSRKYLLDYAPEFLEGLGHRMLVTTAHREEVQEILSRAMLELGFAMVEESVGEVLDHLKTISGRLALRILGDDARAREAVSLGVVAAYLRATGELNDAILIPVDSHPEIFAPRARRKQQGTPRARCDLIRIQLRRNRLIATFIEVKSRSASGAADELLNRIADQIEATEQVFRDLFFKKDPVRLDHVLQRSRLITILRFYLKRARRYGLVSSDERLGELLEAIERLETGIPDLRAERWGFVVNLAARPQRLVRVQRTDIRFITARDVAEAGLAARKPVADDGGSEGSSGDGAGSANHPSESGREKDSAADAWEKKDSPQPSASGEGVPPSNDEFNGGDSSPSGDSRQADGSLQVELGSTLGDQAPVLWKPSVRGSPHLFILGIPGQGKSWTVTRILRELATQNLPALVIDFHGQFVEPSGSYTRVAQPAVLDAAKGLPFSPFEAEAKQTAGASFWRTNCFAVAEIFQYVCELGDIQRDVVYEALRDSYLDLGFGDGKADRLPSVEEVRKRLEECEQARGVRNVVPRCRPLLELGLFRDGVEDAPELRELLSRGLVVGLQNLGLETLQLAAGAFLLRKIYKDMFLWGEADKLRLAIVLDEAHRLARDVTLPKIMKEGRKFGIAVIVASQGLADYHPDVVGNAGTKVVFRTNFPMSKKVAGFLRGHRSVDLAAAIEQLDVGEAYVQTPEMAVASRVRMHPLQ